MVSLAVLFPWGLGVKADPFLPTPAGIQPEWYFLFMFQALQLIPAKIGFWDGEILGILFFLAGFLFMVLVPLLDRRAAKGEKSPFFTLLGVLIVLFIAGMTLLAVIVPR